MRTLTKVGVAIVILCGVTNDNGGAIVQAKNPNRPSQHASIQAYPDAIVSATDAASGITVSVDRDGKTVSARNSAGTVLWQADVLKETGLPSTGFPVVRRIDIGQQGAASLIIGKHRAVEVDLQSGKMKLFGEN
jgi:hypothetical protein